MQTYMEIYQQSPSCMCTYISHKTGLPLPSFPVLPRSPPLPSPHIPATTCAPPGILACPRPHPLIGPRPRLAAPILTLEQRRALVTGTVTGHSPRNGWRRVLVWMWLGFVAGEWWGDDVLLLGWVRVGVYKECEGFEVVCMYVYVWMGGEYIVRQGYACCGEVECVAAGSYGEVPQPVHVGIITYQIHKPGRSTRLFMQPIPKVHQTSLITQPSPAQLSPAQPNSPSHLCCRKTALHVTHCTALLPHAALPQGCHARTHAP